MNIVRRNDSGNIITKDGSYGETLKLSIYYDNHITIHISRDSNNIYIFTNNPIRYNKFLKRLSVDCWDVPAIKNSKNYLIDQKYNKYIHCLILGATIKNVVARMKSDDCF